MGGTQVRFPRRPHQPMHRRDHHHHAADQDEEADEADRDVPHRREPIAVRIQPSVDVGEREAEDLAEQGQHDPRQKEEGGEQHQGPKRAAMAK